MPFVAATTATSGGSTTFTFSSHAIGTAHAYRRVVVVIYASGSITNTIDSVTIGGVAATIDVEHTSEISNGPMAIASLPVSSGTTADIVVSTGGFTASQCRIAVYAVTGVSGIPALRATGQTRSSSTTMLNRTLSLVTGDEVIGGVGLSGTNASSQDIAWTNLTQDDESSVNVTSRDFSAASIISGTTGNLTITGTIGSNFDMGLIVAAYSIPSDVSLIWNPQANMQPHLVR